MFIAESIEHNDGGTNCFITNNSLLFTSHKAYPVSVKLLNGSTACAEGFGLKLIRCPTSKVIISLWPTYYMPLNPQCTFSPTVLKHYLQYPTVSD
jgi:hypothetical protein